MYYLMTMLSATCVTGSLAIRWGTLKRSWWPAPLIIGIIPCAYQAATRAQAGEAIMAAVPAALAATGTVIVVLHLVRERHKKAD